MSKEVWKMRKKGHKFNGKPCPVCGKTHADMTGSNNPSKRPEVRRKISKKLTGRKLTDEWKAKLWLNRKRKDKFSITCKNCEKVFISSDQKRQFCCNNCNLIYRKVHAKKQKCICLTCGNEFLSYYKQKFCSSKCYGIKKSKHAFISCQVCGKIFWGKIGRKFCSKICYGTTIRGKNNHIHNPKVFKKYLKSMERVWKDPVIQKKRRESLTIYTIDITYFSKNWFNIRRAVLRRDNFRCSECGETNIKKLTVHHIVPLKFSGNNNFDNLITLCKSCHSSIEAKFFKIVREVRLYLGEDLVGNLYGIHSKR